MGWDGMRIVRLVVMFFAGWAFGGVSGALDRIGGGGEVGRWILTREYMIYVVWFVRS